MRRTDDRARLFFLPCRRATGRFFAKQEKTPYYQTKKERNEALFLCGTAALSKQQKRQKGCDYLGSGGKDIRARQDKGKEGEE